LRFTQQRWHGVIGHEVDFETGEQAALMIASYA
jgi:hypothetical protein